MPLTAQRPYRRGGVRETSRAMSPDDSATPMPPQGPPATRPGRLTSEEGLVWAMIAAHTIVFTVLCYLRYRSFFACEWQDVAAANQIAYHTAHGRLFYQSLTEQHFLAHSQPIYLLLAIPYRVFSHISTLHFLLSLSFSLGALPLFWIVRERTVSRGAGALCAWVYLSYAPLNYLNLSDFRAVLLAPPIMVWGLYFIEQNRFRPFLVACFLAMCCKENVALSVILLGLYGSFRHRRVRWGLTTVCVGLVWVVVSIKYVVPWCLRDVRYPHEIGTYWHQWTGDMTLPEFVKSSLTNPLPLVNLVFSYHRLDLLFRLLWPLCFLSLLSPQIVIIGLPGLLQLLLAQHMYLSVKRIHWVSNGVFFTCVAAIYSFVWISNWYAKLGVSRPSRRFVEYALLLAMGTSSTLSNVLDNKLGTIDYLSSLHNDRFVHVRNMYSRQFRALGTERRKAWEIISQIPKSASVHSHIGTRSSSSGVPCAIRRAAIGTTQMWTTSLSTPGICTMEVATTGGQGDVRSYRCLARSSKMADGKPRESKAYLWYSNAGLGDRARPSTYPTHWPRLRTNGLRLKA